MRINNSLKDNKGDYSLRKLMAIISFILLVAAFITQLATGVAINDSFIWVFASLTGINIGAWTIQNLIMLKNGGSI